MFKISQLFCLLILPVFVYAYSNKLSGYIFDSKTDRPRTGANVEIPGTSQGASTDENGNFLIENIKPGKHILKVSYIGYKSVQKNVFISFNQTVGVSVVRLEHIGKSPC